MDVKPRCTHCNSPLFYNKKFDSQYCKHCDEWTEFKCEDLVCEFCTTRPLKPSEANK